MKGEKHFNLKINEAMSKVLHTKEELGENRVSKKESSHQKRKIVEKNITSGGISIKNFNFFVAGVVLIWKGSRNWLDELQQNMVDGKIDITKSKIILAELKESIYNTIRVLMFISNKKDKLNKSVDFYKENNEAFQLAKDGMIVLQRDGKTKYVGPGELYDMLKEYDDITKISVATINNYISIGINFVSLVGTLQINKGEEDKKIAQIPLVKEIFELIYMRTIYKKVGETDTVNNLIEQIRSNKLKSYDLKKMIIGGNTISKAEREEIVKKIEYYDRKMVELDIKQNLMQESLCLAVEIATSLMTGIYVISTLKTKGKNQKLDSKDYAKILTSIDMRGSLAQDLVQNINELIKLKEKNKNAANEKLMEEIQSIKQQVEEIMSLDGATESFDSFSLNDFECEFYRTENPETGEIESKKIVVPEFSMKRGECVLLSGESGAGKSTLLRFMKRGDLNKRKAFVIDGKKRVDFLGDEIISINPNIEVGNGLSMISEITGTEKLEDLNKADRKRFMGIIHKLGLDEPHIMQRIEEKNRYSTGELKRFALAKVIYRMKQNPSVMIVDEPVGNVQEKMLIDELRLITKYAKKRNIMCILVTHRVDLAEKLVDKRYHISEDGVVLECPIQKEEEINR